MGKVINISNQKFNNLTAIKTVKVNGKTKWLFKCDCGKDYIQLASPVKRGRAKSCGCMQGRSEDLTGKKFNKLTVTKELGGGKVECKCDCGEQSVKLRAKVKSGHTKSCGCLSSKQKDYSGMKFGNIFVVDENAKDKCNKILCNCICDCGKEILVSKSNLKSGNTKSCGCMKAKLFQESKTKDLANKKFNRLTALEIVKYSNNGAIWKCECECGKNSDVLATNLISGHTKSCGCLASEITKKIFTKESRVKDNPLYSTWIAMKGRCKNKKNPAYKDYGGRGIDVCERWDSGEDEMTGFECFIFDMGDKPNSDYSLDRIDNEKGYCVENCRWASKVDQRKNQRSIITNAQYNLVLEENMKLKEQIKQLQKGVIRTG